MILSDLLKSPCNYRAVLADPAWQYEVSHLPGERAAEDHYDTMTLAQIKGLPVNKLSVDGAHLYLWVTNTLLDQGFQVMKAWGFEYITILTWFKFRMGMGSYFRNFTEHILFGVKRNQGKSKAFSGDGGKLKDGVTMPNVIFEYVPPNLHSRKPMSQYALIEKCSEGPYLELFSREERPGWDCWGNDLYRHRIEDALATMEVVE